MKKIPIIYENEEILIINKPAGISVQGGKDISHPLDKELPLQLGYPIYLVHRLDKETSGLMIVAKSPLHASIWTKIIGGKLVTKEYTAICAGTLEKKQGTIKSAIMQHGSEKPAITNYTIQEEKDINIEEYAFKISKLKLILQTGRMHQIRIHLSKINCPIIADDKHGNFKLNKQFRKIGIKQLLLCASKLTVPINGKNYVFEIPLPEYFNI